MPHKIHLAIQTVIDMLLQLFGVFYTDHDIADLVRSKLTLGILHWPQLKYLNHSDRAARQAGHGRCKLACGWYDDGFYFVTALMHATSWNPDTSVFWNPDTSAFWNPDTSCFWNPDTSVFWKQKYQDWFTDFNCLRSGVADGVVNEWVFRMTSISESIAEAHDEAENAEAENIIAAWERKDTKEFDRLVTSVDKFVLNDAFVLAAKRLMKDLASELLDKGADVNSVSGEKTIDRYNREKEKTAFEWATFANNAPMMEFLMDRGALGTGLCHPIRHHPFWLGDVQEWIEQTQGSSILGDV